MSSSSSPSIHEDLDFFNNSCEASPLDFNMLFEQIYEPHGALEWLQGKPIIGSRVRSNLAGGDSFSLTLKTGIVENRVINYISKSSTSPGLWNGFSSELCLYKCHLKSLQGIVVPTVIGVYCNLGEFNIAMEPPHRSFWTVASSEMPDCLKRRCVQALAKLHECGVCHADIKLSNFLIGADTRVTVINFDKSRALVPNSSVGLEPASTADLRMEMRKLRWLLDFEDARAEENSKYVRSLARFCQISCDYSGAKEIDGIEEIDLPVHPELWTPDLVRDTETSPSRVLMPDQTVDDLSAEVNQFLALLEECVPIATSSLCSSLSSELASMTSPDRPPLRPFASTHPTNDVLVATRRSSLRKRKLDSERDLTNPPVKKLRFTGVPEEEPLPVDSDYENRSEDALSSSIPVSSISHASTTEQIIEANIRRCVALGLPHPEALRRYPNSPRWRHPVILEYRKQHSWDVPLAAERINCFSGRRNFRLNVPKRSIGGLKRAVRSIAKATGIVETTTLNNLSTRRKRKCPGFDINHCRANKRSKSWSLDNFCLETAQEPEDSRQDFDQKSIPVSEDSRIPLPVRWLPGTSPVRNRKNRGSSRYEIKANVSPHSFEVYDKENLVPAGMEVANSSYSSQCLDFPGGVWRTYTKVVRRWMDNFLNVLRP